MSETSRVRRRRRREAERVTRAFFQGVGEGECRERERLTRVVGVPEEGDILLHRRPERVYERVAVPPFVHPLLRPHLITCELAFLEFEARMMAVQFHGRRVVWWNWEPRGLRSETNRTGSGRIASR